MRGRQIAAAAGLIAGVLVLDAPDPASASITATTSGTVMTLTMAGEESISFACAGGKAAYRKGSSTVTPTPSINCSALTEVQVGGDVAAQTVDGTGLGAAAFAAKPKLVALLGDGPDVLTETPNADTIGTGPGNDVLYLGRAVAANTILDLGSGGSNIVRFIGTDQTDRIAAASSNANITFEHNISGEPVITGTVLNAASAIIEGNKGNDILDASGVLIPSTVSIDIRGGDGDDLIAAAQEGSTESGGSGANIFELKTGLDQVVTDSDTDTVNALADAYSDYVNDTTSLRFGGRKLTGFGNTGSNPTDTYRGLSEGNDVAVRVRPQGGGSLVTFSLNRMGQQVLPAEIEVLEVDMVGYSELPTRVLADVVMTSQDLRFSSLTGERELYDITVPGGVFTTTTQGFSRVVTSSAPGTGVVRLPIDAAVVVHGPFANVNESFAHRVHRDLVHRIPSNEDRAALGAQLSNGTKSRGQVVAGLVNSDEYRGIDVDRVFFRYLRRSADSGGRTYWIGSLRNGKSLRQFRAQLFGSSEYFTKAGGTNAKFVERAYEDVLGRKPDPSGQAYWTNKANNGTERGLIARQFLSSAEAKRTIIRDQHLRFLDRQPTASEISTWSTILDSQANGEQQLISSLATSASYFNRT